LFNVSKLSTVENISDEKLKSKRKINGEKIIIMFRTRLFWYFLKIFSIS